MLVAQGDLPEALQAYRDSLAIAERLAAADPSNAEWQRDLSVSYEKIAEADPRGCTRRCSRALSTSLRNSRPPASSPRSMPGYPTLWLAAWPNSPNSGCRADDPGESRGNPPRSPDQVRGRGLRLFRPTAPLPPARAKRVRGCGRGCAAAPASTGSAGVSSRSHSATVARDTPSFPAESRLRVEPELLADLCGLADKAAASRRAAPDRGPRRSSARYRRR